LAGKYVLRHKRRHPAQSIRKATTRIVTEEAGTPGVYVATRFAYAKNGQAVMFVLGESWNEDGPDAGTCPDDYTVTFLREFRYDSGRARYLNREYDAEDLNENSPVFTVDSEIWTDYDGDDPYGDFTIDGRVMDERSFQPGLGTVDPWADEGGSATNYFHSDHLGTTRGLSNPSAALGSGAVYTAFGERIDGTNHRYGYVGAWGYQSHNEFPFLHIGARYYDPSIGRFLQRDPIGLKGGTNHYAYAMNAPSLGIDPAGMRFRLPGAMGPADRGFLDPFWSKVHYCAGWCAGKAGHGCFKTLELAIDWEILEPKIWPGFQESFWNQIGDIFIAAKGWIDSHL
jgi:RHS repeat-associated protein